MKITNQWKEGNEKLGEVVYDYRQIAGIKKFMKRHELAKAIFGQFEVVGKSVVHSTYNGDSGEYDGSDSVSEYLDDLNFLRNGNVEFIY